MTPAELVERAVAAGVTTLAITDHDTTAGLGPAREAAKDLPIEVIPGIEISCYAGKREIHVLGYLFRDEDEALQELLVRMRQARVVRMRQMLEQLAAVGVRVELDQVVSMAGGDSIGRPHLARALVTAGHARDWDDAFDTYIGFGKPGYVARTTLSPQQAVEALRAAGGVAVLAHPALVRDNDLVRELLDAGFQGLEVWHPSHSPRHVRRYRRLARSRGLVATGGSDFHDPESTSRPPLGSMRVPAEVVEQLRLASQSDA